MLRGFLTLLYTSKKQTLHLVTLVESFSVSTRPSIDFYNIYRLFIGLDRKKILHTFRRAIITIYRRLVHCQTSVHSINVADEIVNRIRWIKYHKIQSLRFYFNATWMSKIDGGPDEKGNNKRNLTSFDAEYANRSRRNPSDHIRRSAGAG